MIELSVHITGGQMNEFRQTDQSPASRDKCLFSGGVAKKNKKFELMLTRRAKAYSSPGSVV